MWIADLPITPEKILMESAGRADSVILIFLMQVVLAGALAWLSAHLAWWAPLLVFPALLRTFAVLKARTDYYPYDLPFREDPYTAFLDFVIMIQGITWIVVAAIICYRGFGAWWGILAGMFVGYQGCAFTTPFRWAFERRQ